MSGPSWRGETLSRLLTCWCFLEVGGGGGIELSGLSFPESGREPSFLAGPYSCVGLCSSAS